MMSRWLSIVFTILVVSFSSEDALARDRGDKHGSAHGKAFKKSHARGEHFEESRDPDYGELEFFAGAPFFQSDFYYWPYYTYSPYYFSPSTIIQSAPLNYIDQGTVVPQVQSLGPSNQDYCLNPAGYYPYVKECWSGWQRINPPPIEQQPGYWYYCTNPAGYSPLVRACSAIWQNVVP
ncbi:MAG TPA: hypothetical protein VIF37_20220 [Methylobacter sp.]|jgi:hypothetical protein